MQLQGAAVLRGYSNCGLLEHALMYNPAYISCVVQPLKIKYISILRVGSGGVHSSFYFSIVLNTMVL